MFLTVVTTTRGALYFVAADKLVLDKCKFVNLTN